MCVSLLKINMEALLPLFAIIMIIALLGLIVKAIISGASNNPTWQGIIISAILGMLPLYLILCWLGFMGERKR